MGTLKENQDRIMTRLEVKAELLQENDSEIKKLIEESEIHFKLREIERNELTYRNINTIKKIIVFYFVISIIVALILIIARFSS